jgi:phosphatidylinositol glycan class W
VSVAVIVEMVKREQMLMLGVMVESLVHMIALWMGLQKWVMGPDRTGLIGLNKEGIVSLPGQFACNGTQNSISRSTIDYIRSSPLPGYIAIYLLGIDLGHYILPPDPYYAFPAKKAALKEEQDDVPDYDSRGISKGQTERRREELAMILVSYSIVWWVVLGVLWACGDRVSRRLVSGPRIGRGE